MMNRIAFKIAASTLIVSLTMVSSTTQSLAMRGGRQAAPANRDAARLHEQAARAIQEGRLADAQGAMEQAVAASPRDAGYRLLLADIYMRSGRFESARATYADVLELDGANTRARLNFALTQIAVGRPAGAVAQIDELNGRASPSDVGLAYALAGQPERAIELLEPAARAQGATARVRQNLALAFAMAGNWRRARAVAAQDVSPADLDARMAQWAVLARPDAQSSRVAGLMGITPVSDPGQPVALALVQPQAAPVQVAEAAPAAAPAAPVVVAQAEAPAENTDSDWGLPRNEAPAPVQIAEAPSYYTPVPQPAEEAPSAAQVQVALAARSLSTPQAPLVRVAAVSLPPAPVFRRAAPRRAAAAPAVQGGNSRYVVQLGAFSNEANAERAWVETQRRFGLTPYAPLTATIDHNGRTLHRVAVSGFASQTDAQRLCGSLKARGGTCFVRSTAGDASIRWAVRYAPGGTRNA